MTAIRKPTTEEIKQAEQNNPREQKLAEIVERINENKVTVNDLRALFRALK